MSIRKPPIRFEVEYVPIETEEQRAAWREAALWLWGLMEPQLSVDDCQEMDRKEKEREEKILGAPTSLFAPQGERDAPGALSDGKTASESVDGQPGDSAACADQPAGDRMGSPSTGLRPSADRGLGFGGDVWGAPGPGPVPMV